MISFVANRATTFASTTRRVCDSIVGRGFVHPRSNRRTLRWRIGSWSGLDQRAPDAPRAVRVSSRPHCAALFFFSAFATLRASREGSSPPPRTSPCCRRTRTSRSSPCPRRNPPRDARHAGDVQDALTQRDGIGRQVGHVSVDVIRTARGGEFGNCLRAPPSRSRDSWRISPRGPQHGVALRVERGGAATCGGCR